MAEEEGEEKEEDKAEEAKSAGECKNLGALGWKFCKSAIVKDRDDRFGRRGTRTRFLLRTATTQDTLEALEDVVKLKMPKGWSTKKVISGKSMREERERREERGDGGGKRRRREGGGGGRRGGNHYEREDNLDYSYKGRDVEESLGMELKSSRGR